MTFEYKSPNISPRKCAKMPIKPQANIWDFTVCTRIKASFNLSTYFGEYQRITLYLFVANNGGFKELN